TLEELRRNARDIEELERQVAKQDEYAERLHRLDADMAYYGQQGIAEKLDRHSRLASDGARLETAARRASEALNDHRDSTRSVVDGLATAASELTVAESEYSGMLNELAGNIEAVRDRTKAALDTAGAQLTELRDRIASALAEWPEHLVGLEDDLRRIQQGLGAGPIDAKRYLDTVGERTALLPIVDGMNHLQDDRRRLQETRGRLLRRLQDERHHGFILRQRAAASVNGVLNGRLRMDVTYLGDTAEFERRLSAVLRGSRLTADAVSSIAGATGVDGVEIANSVLRGTSAVSARFNLTEAMAHRLVSWLTDDPDRLREVEVLAPEDRVAIALAVDGAARDLAELSSGQKATALLLLVFAQGGRPLVLDQPEDDLDNRFVYEDVVSLLRAEKGVTDPGRRRQIIAATHNANIPVNGDAELVLSLADDGGHFRVLTRASIDDRQVREEIRTVLEGGAEAFRRRAQKYGGLDDTQ
ncbi:MAG: hypothetical protein ACRDPY_24540, partial [Streptosporangiaceae bacterium]